MLQAIMATDVTDEWTEKKCLQLIREFRTRPLLWDPKDPYFFKKTTKTAAWQDIGSVMHVSPERCKHKMVILMSSFRREKSKIIHSMRDEKDDIKVYNSTWFAFKDMAFLMDKQTERKRQGEYLDDEDTPDRTSIIVKNHINKSIPPTKKKNSSKPAKKDLVTFSTHATPENLERVKLPQIMPTPGSSQSTSERNEEINSFTTFIGNKMKTYSDTTKNAVQQAICDIIFKADQNYYESISCYQKLTIIDEEELDSLDKDLYEPHGMIKVQNYSDNSD